MRIPHIAGLVALCSAYGVAAQTVSSVGLYDTGTIIDGLNPYTLVSAPADGYSLYVPGDSVWPINGVWLDNTASTKWIAAYSGSAAPAGNVPTVAGGNYVIQLTFDLTGYNPSDVRFGFSAAADNYLSVSLNGTVLSNSAASLVDSAGQGKNYGSLSYYVFLVDGSTQSALQTGTNTLTFTVNNLASAGDNPAGLYVDFTSFEVVPEPSATAALFGGAGVGVVLWRRRRRR